MSCYPTPLKPAYPLVFRSASEATVETPPLVDKRGAWLTGLLAMTLVLNLLDGVLTIFSVMFGAAVEANPLMADLLARSPLQFMLGKMALVSLGVYILWRFRHHVLGMIGIVGAFAIYAIILMHHLRGLQSFTA